MKSVFRTGVLIVAVSLYGMLPLSAAEQVVPDTQQQKTVDQAFVEALQQADIEKAKDALAQGAGIEKKSLWPNGGCVAGETATTPQAGVFNFFYGDPTGKQKTLVQFVLEHGAKPEPTLVWFAAQSGNVSLVELYLSHKADPNAKSIDVDKTPLEGAEDGYAYVLKQLKTVSLEEAKKPRPNMMSGITEPPLLVQKENLEKVIQLLKKASARD